MLILLVHQRPRELPDDRLPPDDDPPDDDPPELRDGADEGAGAEGGGEYEGAGRELEPELLPLPDRSEPLDRSVLPERP